MRSSFPFMTLFAVLLYISFNYLRTCNKQEEVNSYYNYTPSYPSYYGKGPSDDPSIFDLPEGPFDDDIRKIVSQHLTKEQMDSSMRAAIHETYKDIPKIELDSAGKAIYDSITRVKMDSLKKVKG